MERRLPDLAPALALALVISAAWVMRDWGALWALDLPDTDDVVRLQQIRDWLAGQAFGDLSQHRLAGGLAMHWSRLPDLVPGALITMLAPVIGRHGAEVAAVIAWPVALFAVTLYLIGRIARALAPAAAPGSIVVAALAFPVTSLFAPGRIDHHGLQILLVVLIARLLVAAPGLAAGAGIGIASAAALAIGMETAPFLLVAALLLWGRWLRARDARADAMLLGYGLGLAGALALAALSLASDSWGLRLCDGFTRLVWQAAQAGSLLPVALALGGRWLRGVPARLGATALGAAALAPLMLGAARVCANPYGTIDPLLVRLWLNNVEEAQPLLAAAPATAIGCAGLLVAGLAAALFQLRRDPRWLPLLLLQAASLALALEEIRGVYVGTMLGAPALGAMIAAARARGALRLIAAWLASAGLCYPLAAQALVPARGQAPVARCDADAFLKRIDRLPPGIILTPIDRGGRALAATRQRVLAAPYHRNNGGNGALYRVMLASPEAARARLAAWQVEAIAFCRSDFGELGTPPPASLIARLRGGHPPAWAVPLPAPRAMLLFRIDRRLPGAPHPL